MTMKFIIICLFFVFVSNIKSQDKFTLPFKSKIVTDDKPCKDAIVNIYNAENFNVEVDTNKIIQTIYLKPDGILNFEIPSDVSYIIELTKKDYIHKRFMINTTGVPKENWDDNFAGFNVESFELFKPIKGVNYQLLNYPLILIEFDYDTENFYYNETYSNLALAAIINLKDNEAKQLDINKNKDLVKKLNNDLNNFRNIIIILSISLVIVCMISIALIIHYRKKSISI